MSSVVRAGGIMLIGTFAILVLYFVISTPITAMFDSFDDAETPYSDDEMNEYLPNIRTALNMAFAIAIITAAVIFIFWIFHREQEPYRRDKRF